MSEIPRDFKRHASSKIDEMLIKDNNHLFPQVFKKPLRDSWLETPKQEKALDYEIQGDQGDGLEAVQTVKKSCPPTRSIAGL
jgi:hypothetical protein